MHNDNLAVDAFWDINMDFQLGKTMWRGRRFHVESNGLVSFQVTHAPRSLQQAHTDLCSPSATFPSTLVDLAHCFGGPRVSAECAHMANKAHVGGPYNSNTSQLLQKPEFGCMGLLEKCLMHSVGGAHVQNLIHAVSQHSTESRIAKSATFGCTMRCCRGVRDACGHLGGPNDRGDMCDD